MIEIYLTNEVTNNLDLSARIIDISNIHKHVESDKPGEAGLIVFDKLSLEFPISAFPNNDFDPANLDTYGRYLIQIRVQLETSHEVFSGVVDKSTVSYTASQTVRFDVLDKLSALILLEKENARRKVYPLWQRVTDTNIVKLVVCPHASGYNSEKNRTFADVKAYDSSDQEVPLTGYETFYAGEIIGGPDDNRFYVVHVEQPSDLYLHGDQSAANNVIVTGEGTTYENKFYDTFIHYADGSYVVSFNTIPMIEAIVKLIWPEVNVVNKTGVGVFNLSLDYYEDTIFDYPLQKHPLDTLKYLATTMRVYIFFANNGDLVIQKMNQAEHSLGSLSIDKDTVVNWSKKYQWDKKIDYVLIKKIDGYDPDDPATYGEAPQDIKYQPRNPMEREIFDKIDDSLQDVADDYYDFYGVKRQSAMVDIPLDENNVDTDLLYKIEYDDKEWLLISITMGIAPGNEGLSLEIVEL